MRPDAAGRIDPHSTIDGLDALIRTTLVAGELDASKRRLLAEALAMLADREQDLLLHTYLSISPRRPPTFAVRTAREAVEGLPASTAIRLATDRSATGSGVEVVADDPEHGTWTMFTAADGEPLELCLPTNGATGPARLWAERVLGWAASIETDPSSVATVAPEPLEGEPTALVEELSDAVAARLAPRVAAIVVPQLVEALAPLLTELVNQRVEAALRLNGRDDGT